MKIISPDNQALERTQPLLPVSFGKTEQRTHDYKRHGTTNLFAALEILTGNVNGARYPRRRTREFMKFMNKIARRYSGKQEIHVVLDNLSTHANADVTKWLKKHPNFTFHYTPKGSSWINQIETWFGIITRQAIRRGSFRSLADLINRIHALERGCRAVRVDSDRWQHPGQGRRAGSRLQEPRCQQHQIKVTE